MPKRGSRETGGRFQCDCEAKVERYPNVCACTKWFTIPPGVPVPRVKICPDCAMGKHQ